MTDRSKRLLAGVLSAVLTAQSLGCGTIIYPERRGQRSGRIDVGVVLLDGIGLLFFILPGVIAFAVDFGDGAIYLPGGSRADIRRVPFDPAGDRRAQIEAALSREAGRPVSLDDENLKAVELRSAGELPARFAAARRRS